MLPKVVKQTGAHELFMNAYVVAGQRYYYIDFEGTVMATVMGRYRKLFGGH